MTTIKAEIACDKKSQKRAVIFIAFRFTLSQYDQQSMIKSPIQIHPLKTRQAPASPAEQVTSFTQKIHIHVQLA